jgi:hypothetical protein
MSKLQYQRIGRRNVEVTTIRRAVKQATATAKLKGRKFSVLYAHLWECDEVLIEAKIAAAVHAENQAHEAYLAVSGKTRLPNAISCNGYTWVF